MNVFKLIEENGLTLHGDIEHFAELIRQEEREACAKVCDNRITNEAGMQREDYENRQCAEAIRARGEQ